MTLSDLGTGQQARILQVNCEGATKRRLHDLGFVAGTIVQPDLRSPAGDPVAYRVRGSRVALRSSDARNIVIEPLAADSKVN